MFVGFVPFECVGFGVLGLNSRLFTDLVGLVGCVWWFVWIAWVGAM